MQLEEITIGTGKIVEVIAEDIVIHTLSDALDIIGNADYLGGGGVILSEGHLTPDFFDLSTRLAGDILQKCVNYRKKIAIVGDFSAVSSDALNAFIRECNRGRQIFFCSSRDDAIARMSA